MSHSYYRVRRQTGLPPSSSDLSRDDSHPSDALPLSSDPLRDDSHPSKASSYQRTILPTTPSDSILSTTTVPTPTTPLHATSSSKNSPSTSRTGIPAPPFTTSQRLSPGAITGTAIGVLLGALIFAGLAWLVFHYRRKARRLAAAAARHLNSRNRPKDHSGTAATTWVREKAELPGSEAPVVRYELSADAVLHPRRLTRERGDDEIQNSTDVS